ncbi:alpha/beta hydrolase family protein [Rhizobium azibense]|uniref:Alpha/beta hydrolase family protein n=1 Tax=Rhizobium azibense TaxID=1136135 RepID=A0A4R3QLH4_9HYPH|nr:alpha/beta fold hydrolase [Rhizobium azibense]TCU21887.1 alpha/beta hydrolase family protein [Rhizobium azibense]
MPVGFTEGLSFDHTRTNWTGDGPRPLSWTMWYPAVDSANEVLASEHPIFRLHPIAPDAALKNAGKPHPLVLLSHGSGGVTFGLEWLAHRLAKSGFVALAVNHHGHTGIETYRPEGYLCLWERAADLTALLDDRTWRAKLGGQVTDCAFVAGFSAGAYTAMLIAGARVLYSQFEPENPVKSPIRGPREFPDVADHLPRLIQENEAFRTSWNRRRDDFRDDRVKAALVLAPARSVLGFSHDSLRSISRPIHVVSGDADKTAPAAEFGAWLHRHVANSKFSILKGGVDHYDFLSEPTAQGLRLIPDFEMADGLDRRTLHDEVARLAIEFFENARPRTR